MEKFLYKTHDIFFNYYKQFSSLNLNNSFSELNKLLLNTIYCTFRCIVLIVCYIFCLISVLFVMLVKLISILINKMVGKLEKEKGDSDGSES